MADDPDAAWEVLAPYAVYEAQSFAAWQGSHLRTPGALDDLSAEHLRASAAWRVVTPEQCVALVRDEGPVKLHPLVAGIPLELGWSSLELFVGQVLPACPRVRRFRTRGLEGGHVSLEVDEEFAPILAAVAEMRAAAGGAPPADAFAIRAETDAGLRFLADQYPAPEGLREESFTAPGADDAPIGLRWCAPEATADAAPGPAVVYLHGGGMILGSADLFAPIVRAHVHATGVPFLAVDYRLAPEHPHPTPVEDCFAGLCWLHEHHESLGVDPNRIAVMGESAGGGLAAGVALLARDRGVALAHQILVYPMIDDTNTVPDPALVPYCTSWSYESNAIGWGALLGDAVGGPDVPAAAAPARATDLSGVAPAYVEVGMLDIFRDEDIDYAATHRGGRGVGRAARAPRRAPRLRDDGAPRRGFAAGGRRPSPRDPVTLSVVRASGVRRPLSSPMT